MKVLILVAALCVAAKAFPFPNGTIPKQVTDIFSKLFPNTTLEGIQKALEGGRPSDMFKCVSAEQQAAFTSCRTEAFSRNRQRGPGSRGRGGKRGECAATTESTVEEVTTTVAPGGNRAVRSAPFRAPRLCVPNCFLRKVGVVDADGNVVQTNVTSFIDGLGLTADQKTAAKTAFQNCISTNLTLPNITNIAGPPHRFKGPFANRTLRFPVPDQSCMRSGKALTCLSGAIIQNGCSSAAVKTAAIKWSSSEEYSDEDYHDEAESSEEKFTSAKLKHDDHAELNEAANLEDGGSGDHINGTSSEETGDHNESKRGQRNNRGRKEKRNGQRGGSKKVEGGSTNSTEPQQEAQQNGKAASNRPSRGGNRQRGTGQGNKGNQTAALRMESLTEGEFGDDGSASGAAGDSSDESLEFNKQIPEPPQDGYSQLPGANVGRNPAAGRPGVAFKG